MRKLSTVVGGIEIVKEIPDDAAVIIIKNCGKCEWCVHNNPRKSPICVHPKTQATRPYADDLTGKDRHVKLDTIAEFCPYVY